MSDLENPETFAEAGQPMRWWLVTYLCYALAYLFTFVTAFPTAASPADHMLVYLVNLAIFFFALIFIISIFIFRKQIILFSCFVMFGWVIYAFMNFILGIPSSYRLGGDESLKGGFGFFLIVFFPAFLFLGLTVARITGWRNKKMENTGG